KLKNSWLYWTCQIAGWGTYSVVAFSIVREFTGLREDILIGFLFFFFYSIGLTHFLRRTIQKRKWLAGPPFPGLFYIFAAAVATAILQTVLVVLIARLLEGQNEFDRTAIISTASGLAFMTCAWVAAYVLVHWYRRYRESEL